MSAVSELKGLKWQNEQPNVVSAAHAAAGNWKYVVQVVKWPKSMVMDDTVYGWEIIEFHKDEAVSLGVGEKISGGGAQTLENAQRKARKALNQIIRNRED